jgi:pilus assembly protein CpaE
MTTLANPALTMDRSKAAKLRVGVLGIGLDGHSHDALQAGVTETPGAHVVDNVDRHIVPREVNRLLEAFQYRICVIDFDEGVEDTCQLAERLRDNCDRIHLIAASSDSSAGNIIAAMRSGCTEYLAKPFSLDRISNALAHVESRRHVKEEGAAVGKILTIIGAKGGTGVTSLATHLALNLVGQRGKKVLLVDHHRALGDISLYLGLPRHQYSFYELVHNTDRLDQELLQGFVLQHASGLHVLDSPEVNYGSSHASAEGIEHTLAFLSENYDLVIVDCPPSMTDDNAAAVRQSDQVAIVLTPELPAVRNALRWLDHLGQMQYPADSIDVILNRCAKDNLLNDREIEAALRRPLSVRVPNNYMEVVKAINAGMPVDQKRSTSLSMAFESWADRVVGEAEPDPKEKPGGRSAKLFGLFGF